MKRPRLEWDRELIGFWVLIAAFSMLLLMVILALGGR